LATNKSWFIIQQSKRKKVIQVERYIGHRVKTAIEIENMSSEAKILTKDTVAAYVAAHASDINVFPPHASLTAETIQGGNVNFAFRVTSPCGKCVFVKQAPEYVAIFGPDGFPLTSARIQMEVAVLNEWRAILGEDADQYLAELYYFDDENKVFVMEFLDGFDLLDHRLVSTPAKIAEVSVAGQLGQFMARTHLATHSSRVTAERAATLTAEYENRALRDIQLEFVFTKAYKEVSEVTSKEFTADEAFLKEIDALKARYNGETGEGNFSLCHGDLHPGSVMVKADDDKQEVRVIDPEFTVYGPPGLDVGSLLSGYVLAAVHQSYDKRGESKETAVGALRAAVAAFWSQYKLILGAGGLSDELIWQIEVESVGFTVAEVCRTALGHAGIRLWLQFDDAKVKEAAVNSALLIVQKCIIARHKGGMQVVWDCLDAL